MNYGKVLEDENDVHGLEVGIASRISSLTEAGQILISQSVYEKVQKHDELVCNAISPVKVKGVQHPLQMYRVLWENGRSVKSAASGGAVSGKKRKVFVLAITKEAGKIKISGQEKRTGEQQTVSYYEEVEVDDSRIAKYNEDVINLLNRASTKGHVSRDILNKLKTAGQLLYDEVFSIKLKQELAGTKAEDLILNIDDNLVNIHWELLHDGNSFLCLRFNMGRAVRTRQSISATSSRKIGSPLKMLILSDPQGNLKSAYQEGYSIRDNLVEMEDSVKIDIKSSSVNSAYFMGEIRNYDAVHYAGHADYNTANPSDSGFLLKDRKIKASDVISMIGAKPLPSLVFSNACKSGHTEAWKVKEDYGTAIYGLANAFLLAGVRHYIGTFWNVQDEPGLYFAHDFYKELMNGAMIGEAVRKSRLKLIERYGEDSVIWASYMLYGDPTFRYVQLQEAGEEKTEKAEPKQEELAVAGGNVRAIEDVVSFPPKKQNWLLIASLFVVGVAILVAFSLSRKETISLSVQKPADVSQESESAKSQRIDQLVATLIQNYEDKKEGTAETENIWQTSLPTLVFLNIKVDGISGSDKEFIISRVTDTLQNSGRVQIVEREVLDKLLEELKLSSSRLADQGTALKIGRILSARLMATGSIVREGSDWQISMRIIDTETTSIKAAITYILETKNREDVAGKLGREILSRVKMTYPLEGEILSYGKNHLIINIGKEAGATSGARMKVLSEVEGIKMTVGEIEISSVEEKTSEARIVSQQEEFKKGLKIREIL
jgi:CHAT domain-containing protein